MASSDVLGFLYSNGSDKIFKLTDPSIGSLQFDTLDQETHDWTREVTSNPVENGSPIGDHIIINPRKLTVSGMISNAPIFNSLVEAQNAQNSGFAGEDRVNATFELLEKLRTSKELLTIYTKNAVYQNMVITSISIPRKVEDGEALVFTIEAQEINLVSTATTRLPKGVGIKKTGKKAGKSNATDKETQNRAGEKKDLGKNGDDNSKLKDLSGGLKKVLGMK